MDDKVKVLVSCGALIPSVRVGVLEPLQHHQQNEKTQLRFRISAEVTKEDILWADVLVCVRGCELCDLWVVKAARKAGRYILYFLDDDLLDIPGGNESSPYFSQSGIREKLEEILRFSDKLWCVNPRIAEKYAPYTKEGAQILKVPAEMEKGESAKEEGNVDVFKILYAGSLDHRAVVREYLSEGIERLCEEFKDKIRFTFIGPDPGLSKRENIRHLDFFYDYDQYRRFVREEGFHLGLAPIRETDFYKAKYYNKFIEYSSIGAAGIYTAAEPYILVAEDGKNALLCANTPEDWYRKIRYAVEHPEEMRLLAQEAKKLLEREFSYESVARELEEKIPELSSYKARELREEEIDLPNIEWMFYKEKIKLHFQMYGWMAIPKIGGKALRKLSEKLSKRREP